MGDRFYSQMLGKNGYRKGNILPKRKSDYINELESILGVNIEGLEKITIKTLNKLIEGIKRGGNKKISI